MERDLAKFRAAYHSSSLNFDSTAHLTTSGSGSPWISHGCGEEWIYVDLGAVSDISGVAVHWGSEYALSYDLDISGDGRLWTHAEAGLAGAPERAVETLLTQKARYVRILCRKCSGDHYIINKIEVFGDNDLIYDLPPLPPPDPDGNQPLTGGSWKIRRAAEVPEDGAVLSCEGYDDSDWLKATVPGTALISYLNAGAIPDPNYDDWQFQISEEYFTADFWYRNHFHIPGDKRGQRVFLNFRAINWKADVYFNGAFLKNPITHREHSIEGAFIRAKFDVTGLARCGKDNFLAVLIRKNANPGNVTIQGLAYGPGKNGGLLGADNPTIHAAVGWDWLPTIRGRDTGIYGDVYLSYGGDAELADPWIETKLGITDESAAIVSDDLMKRGGVLIDGSAAPFQEWRGKEGECFTVDFGKAVTLGSVTLLWGSEAGGAAADLESRHPEKFRLETSVDGVGWTNFDAYPGGEIDAKWFGILNAGPNAGHDDFEGHAVSDSIQGPTAVVPVDMTKFGSGIREMQFFSPQDVRFLRFTVVKRRELNGRPVDTRVREIRAYAESPQQAEQSMTRSYILDTSRAGLIFRTDIRNLSDKPIAVELCGKIAPGDLSFSKKYSIAPGETLPAEIPLVLEKPRLWWPNTYGDQFLYTAETELRIDGAVSDKKTFRFGVRRFDYPTDGGLLTLYCNGVRVVCKGGNWGMGDGLKRDTARVLDSKVRLHAEANMTMIRNWVGMTEHPGFYDACDKYGILVWDDFWLANPMDGPDPEDPAMFLENAADKIRRVRSHPSLVFYCGRNEGDPNNELDAGLRKLTEDLDGSRFYFPNSAMPPVGSGGGYMLAMPGGSKGIKQYFDDVSSPVLRSERGIPNVPNLESVRKFIKPENLWPISEAWALHDWTYRLNGPANTYMHALQSYLGGDFEIPVDHVQGAAPDESDPEYLKYKAEIARMCKEAGEAWTLEDFFRTAQVINYDNHRGMFDALSVRRSNGLLMWMSQSSWPSFMWQTYDYYLDTNGGYFGVKSGNQPTRAVFDPRDDSVVLSNATPHRYEGLETTVEVFDLNGELVSSQKFKTDVLGPDAYGVRLTQADFSASGTDIVFLKLTLSDSAGHVLGHNVYWHNRKEYQDYRALNQMSKAELRVRAKNSEITENGAFRCTLMVENGPVPVICARIRLLGKDGAEVLPVFYSDNYLTMMPGEVRTVTVECDAEMLYGSPEWELSGWNLLPKRCSGS